MGRASRHAENHCCDHRRIQRDGCGICSDDRVLRRPLDEIWAIARRQERLKALQAPCPVRPLALDLTDPASFSEYQALLEQEQPRVALLINASGFGKFAATWQTPLAVNQAMVALNCQAVLAMCQLTLPYLGEGSCIVNLPLLLRSSRFRISMSTPRQKRSSCN